MTDVQTTDTELHDEGMPCRSDATTTRRCMLLGAGAVGATAVLAACGTSTSSTNDTGSDFSTKPAPAGSGPANAIGGGTTTTGGTTGGSASGGGTTGGAASGTTLAATSDIPQGGGIIAGKLVITQPVAGTYKAFSTVCTHAGCDVNKVDGGVISCPCHGSKFSIETGEPTAGPATKALPETKVKVDGANIVAA
jgi:nitrite reductase/ring-hydroxylating ferredoxin subunit